MRLILVEFEPGRWAIVYPALKYQDLPDITQCKMPAEYAGKRMVVMTQDQLDAVGSIECPSQLMVDENGAISKDTGWLVNLMSIGLIYNKYIKRLYGFISVELAKESPDVVQLMKWDQQLRVAPQFTTLQIYQAALASLQYAEVEKPTIRSKLEAKIAELAGA